MAYWLSFPHHTQVPGCIAQAVTCLTADPGVVSSILAQFHTFVKIDHEIISMDVLLPCTDSRRVVVNYKPKCEHQVLDSQAYPGKKYG